MSGNNHTTQVSWSLPFETEPDRPNGFSPLSTNAQLAIEELRNSFKGKGFQTAFIGNGTVKNEWLKSEDSNMISSKAPDIFKFNARCVGIDYTNKSNQTDLTVIVCISNAGNGSNLDRFYKWTLNQTRVALKTNETSGFTVNVGDKMALYVLDTVVPPDKSPFDMIVTMDFIVTADGDNDISEDYTGDFSSGDIPAVGTITEIFT